MQLKYLEESQQTGIYDEATVQAVMQFQTDMNANYGMALKVTGLCDVDTLTALEQRATETVNPSPSGNPEFPGGFPGGFPSGGGGRPSFGGGAGGMAGSLPEEDMNAETGGVTPGEALTSSHASGTKDTTAYGAAVIDLEDETQSISLDGESLNIMLRTAQTDQVNLIQTDYTVAISEDGSVLYLDGGSAQVLEWSLDGLALRALNRGGVDVLCLSGGGSMISLPTSSLLSGNAYDALRTAGHTDNTFEYTISLSGGNAEFAVTANGERYAASQQEGAEMQLSGVYITTIDDSAEATE